MSQELSLYWPLSNNFGDLIGKYILEKMTGRPIKYAEPHADYPRYVFGGSVINHVGPKAIVWGAGLGTITDGIDPNIRISAVRGPITRARALSVGLNCPAIYGDPGLLLPRFYKPTSKRDRPVGIVPHYVDQYRAYDNYRHTYVINVFNPIEQVIEEINSCKFIVSSSLHGIVVAHAYGIPAVWVKMSDSLGGDGTKFRDYFASVGMDVQHSVDLRNTGKELPVLEGQVPNINAEEFWNVCPVPVDYRKPEYR